MGERESYKLSLRKSKLENFFINRRRIAQDIIAPEKGVPEDLISLFCNVTDPYVKSNLILNLLNSEDYTYINYTIYMLQNLFNQEVEVNYLRQLLTKEIFEKIFHFLKMTSSEELRLEVTNSSILKNKLVGILVNASFYDLLCLKDIGELELESFDFLLRKEQNMDTIDSVFIVLGNIYDVKMVVVNSQLKRIFSMVINFIVSYHNDNNVLLEASSNILRVAIIILGFYFRLTDSPFMAKEEVLNSFNFLSTYLTFTNVTRNVVLAIQYITEKSDENDIIYYIDI